MRASSFIMITFKEVHIPNQHESVIFLSPICGNLPALEKDIIGYSKNKTGTCFMGQTLAVQYRHIVSMSIYIFQIQY